MGVAGRINVSLREGFTLLEMSIVLTIVALVAGTSVSMGLSMIDSAQRGQTLDKLNVLEAALASYRTTYNRLPCPADPRLLKTDANYGVEAVTPGSCTGNGPGTPAAPFVDAANNVVEGAVPFQQLNLPEEFMYDGWGRKFAYAVNYKATAALAMKSEPVTDACGIAVTNAGGTNRTVGAFYTLVSFGSDGHGGYLKSGTRMNAGSTNADEKTNCHCDQSGVATTYAASYVMKDQTLNPSISTDKFDDLVRFKERGQMLTYDDMYNASGTTLCPQHIWVADSGNNWVQKFDSSGNYESQIGSVSGGNGNGQLNFPTGVAVDGNGNIWVADTDNARVQEFNSSGAYLSQFCSHGFGNGNCYSPQSIAFDGSGNIWVADTENNRVEEFNGSGTWLQTIPAGCPNTSIPACPPGFGNGQFNNYSAHNIAIDGSGNIWVTDSGNNRVEEFNRSGNWLQTIPAGCPNTSFPACPNGGSGNGQLYNPKGIATDSGGNIWVADTFNNRVQKFNRSGNYLSKFGSSGSGNGWFSSPGGIAIDSGGNVWVVDNGNYRVEEFDSSGNYQSQFGGGNGPFSDPGGIAIH